MVAPAYFAAMSTSPEKKSTKTALITGATGGIGLELAKLFARDGYALVLVSRNKKVMDENAPELRRLGAPWVMNYAKDLAELEAPDEVFAYTERANLQIDALVNNAGYGVRGAFAKTNLDEELEMMQLNMVALTQLTKLYLPQMIARGSGKIMQVASTAAFQPGPFMAVYYATKAYVLSFSEALYEELRGTGVTVTALCPGATKTGFADRAGMDSSKLFLKGAMDSKPVAEEGYRGMMAGKPLVITGTRNKLMTFSERFAPRSLVRKIVRGIQE
ncbi:MAG: short-chain dehydrogenase/reductase [Acidobacteriales bacterium]|nr:short-chain dehydrogenase/reductase [Terriglobales bacterium]